MMAMTTSNSNKRKSARSQTQQATEPSHILAFEEVLRSQARNPERTDFVAVRGCRSCSNVTIEAVDELAASRSIVLEGVISRVAKPSTEPEPSDNSIVVSRQRCN